MKTKTILRRLLLTVLTFIGAIVVIGLGFWPSADGKKARLEIAKMIQ